MWFEALYEETVDKVFRYALMLTRNRELADDVTSEVYLRAWQGRRAFRGDGSPLSWLLSITRNTALSWLRRPREVADMGLLEEHGERAAEPPDPIIAVVGAGELDAAMRQLTSDQRQVLFLRFFEALPHQAVGTRLGKTANTVRQLQFRALTRLRKLVRRSDDAGR